MKPSPNHTSVADFINNQISLGWKSQIDIAREAGFSKANIITMIKQGRTKLPMEKIGKFAKAIEVDPLHLFKLCMEEYWPDSWAEIQCMTGQPVLTLNELEILETLRQANVINPKLRTEEDRQRLLTVINSLKSDHDIDD